MVRAFSGWLTISIRFFFRSGGLKIKINYVNLKITTEKTRKIMGNHGKLRKIMKNYRKSRKIMNISEKLRRNNYTMENI